MTWGQLLRLGVELAIDAVRGKLGPLNPSPPVSLPWRDVERQAQASRNAGHEPPPRGAVPPTGRR